MKKLAIAVTVTGLLSACGTGSIQSDYTKQAQQQAALQTVTMASAVSQAPEWMSRLPKAPGMVFENGTATSSDFAMADMKAKTIAYAKICTSAGGKVRSQTKVYTADNGTTSTEASEMAIRNICPDIDISGVETVEMKHVAEGARIRTYVLVALSQDARGRQDIKRSAKEAFNELDEITSNKPVGTDNAIKPQKGEEISVVNPNGTSGTLNLMPVENAEYRARRAEAIQKPGAVVGQASVNN